METKNSLTTLPGGGETVKVRQLPLCQLPNYMACVEDDPATIELFRAKPKGWANELTRESAEQIITTGEKLNLDFFDALCGEGGGAARKSDARAKEGVDMLKGIARRAAKPDGDRQGLRGKRRRSQSRKRTA